MRAMLVALVVAATACGSTVDQSTAPSGAASSGALGTASPSPSPALSSSPSPIPNKTAGPGTYVSVGLGYRLDLAKGWRRSECGSPLTIAGPPANEEFTPAPVDEETGSDMGAHQEEVAVHVEAAGATPTRDWFTLRIGGSTSNRVEQTTLDGKDAFRLVDGPSGLLLGYALTTNGRTYVLYRAYAMHRGSNTYDAEANALMASFHVLTDAELATARVAFQTPAPIPARTADEVAAVLVRGFAQKDVSLLASVAAPCLTHAREQAGPDWATAAHTLADLQRSFSKGLVVAVTPTIGSDTYSPHYVPAAWNDPADTSRPHKDVQLWLEATGNTWYWTGWIDLMPR